MMTSYHQMRDTNNKTILYLSLPLIVLISIASIVGLLMPEFYAAETANWQAQCMGQDLINLFLLVPCLLITSILAFKNNRIASLIWAGTMLYLVYTFVIYCFAVHFNSLFIVYCFCLGLSFYSVIYFLYAFNNYVRKEKIEVKPVDRYVGFYFIIISLLFYFLWLSEIIPAIFLDQIPGSVIEAGLFTNAVHVIDLAVILPAIFMAGVFLLKGKPLGIIFAPVFLSFFILMDITIGTLTVIMNAKGVSTELSVATIMTLLSLFSLMLLILFFRNDRGRINQ